MLHERFDRAYSLLVYNEIQEYGSQTSLSAERFQKGFTKEVNLAFKIQIIVVKSRFYNDFSLYIALSFDGITLCSRPLKSFDK